jgi:putative ABC transport system ATP-binding protein
MSAGATPDSAVDEIVRAVGVAKAYGHGSGRVVALDGVDLDVRRGELLAVAGPSGCGKTTLLHCLSGIAAPDRGQVLVGGTDLASLTDDARTDLRARRMGFVLQARNLLPALTVAENVELPLVHLGFGATEIRARRTEVLTAVGLEARTGAFPSELSIGEQQRIALARALITRPAVIWADEPAGALDTGNAERMLDLLRAAAGMGATVVMVTHAREQAERADRIVAMRDGRIVTS